MVSDKRQKVRTIISILALVIFIGTLVLLFVRGDAFDTYLLGRIFKRFAIYIVLSIIIVVGKIMQAKKDNGNQSLFAKKQTEPWSAIRGPSSFGSFDDDSFDTPKPARRRAPSLQTNGTGDIETKEKRAKLIMIGVFFGLLLPAVLLSFRYLDGTGAPNGLSMTRLEYKAFFAVGVGLLFLGDYLTKKFKARGLTTSNARLAEEVVRASRLYVQGKSFETQHETALKTFFARLQRKRNNIPRIVGEDLDDFARAFHREYTTHNGFGWYVLLWVMSIGLSMIAMQIYLMVSFGEQNFFGIQTDYGTVALFLFWGVLAIPLAVVGTVSARKKNNLTLYSIIMVLPTIAFAYLLLIIKIAQVRPEIWPNLNAFFTRSMTAFVSPFVFAAVVCLTGLCALLLAELKKHKTRIYWRGYLRQRAQSE